eukprot:2974522-Amphidinium_carterae.1
MCLALFVLLSIILCFSHFFPEECREPSRAHFLASHAIAHTSRWSSQTDANQNQQAQALSRSSHKATGQSQD